MEPIEDRTIVTPSLINRIEAEISKTLHQLVDAGKIDRPIAELVDVRVVDGDRIEITLRPKGSKEKVEIGGSR